MSTQIKFGTSGWRAVIADEFTVALAAGTPIATVDGDADAFAAELPTDAPLLGAISATHHPG